MQNTKRLLTIFGLIGMTSLAGCVYKIDIQQGNIVSQDMVDKLRPGMSRSQSRFVLGTPLIQDTFHPGRWDYVYTIQPAGGTRLQERETLLFNDAEQLSGLNGDFVPGMGEDAVILSESTITTIDEKITRQPDVQQPAKPGSLEETLQIEVDSAEVIAVPIPESIEEQAE
jgi:outer membrane protein assembly factor BamE